RYRNREAERFGRLEIDDEFELCRLFDGKIRRLGTLQKFVDVSCRAPCHVADVWSICQEPAIIHELSSFKYSRQMMRCAKGYHTRSHGVEFRIRENNNRFEVFSPDRREC